MKAPSFLPLKLKRDINSLLRSVGLLEETTRKVSTRKPRKAKVEKPLATLAAAESTIASDAITPQS